MQKFCKRQNGEKHFCRNAAKPRNFFEVFAGVPQVSRKTFWRLRESRKSHGKLFGVCGSPASASGNALAFAGAPQVSRKTFWHLREPRKSHEKLFGVCGSSASLPENFLVFAGVPQTLALIQYEEWECSLSTVHAKNRRWHLCRHFRTASNPC